MTRLTPELVTELFCPTLISCENPNVNGAVEKFLEQNVWQKNTKKVYDFVFECMGTLRSRHTQMALRLSTRKLICEFWV